MKILHIGNALGGGGAENVFARSVQLLRAGSGGADQHLLATCGALYRHPELEPDLELESWTRGPATHRPGYFYLWSNDRRLTAWLAREQPDVVHLHGFLAQLSPAVLQALRRHRRHHRCRVVHTVHSHELICANASAYDWRQGRPCTDCLGDPLKLRILHRRCDRRGWLYSWGKGLRHLIYRALWPHCIDCFIAPSDFVRATLLAEGIAPAQVRVIYNPVTTPVAADRPRDGQVIAAFGRFSPEKNLPLLVAAFDRLALEPGHEALRLLLIGAGEDRARIQAAVAASASRNRIRLLDYMDGPALAATLASASIMALPSRALETFALVIPEAIALGLVPIVTDRGAMPELIRLLGCGTIVAEDGLEPLVSGLRRLLTNYAAEARGLQSARRILAAEFSADTYVERVQALYHSG